MDFHYTVGEINEDHPSEESQHYSELAEELAFCFGRGAESLIME